MRDPARIQPTPGHPIRKRQPRTGRLVTMGWVDGDTFRWEIATPDQRLRKWDALAKDADVWERVVERVCRWVEVLDRVDGMWYCISVADFNAHRYLLDLHDGEQWAVDREHWEVYNYDPNQPTRAPIPRLPGA